MTEYSYIRIAIGIRQLGDNSMVKILSIMLVITVEIFQGNKFFNHLLKFIWSSILFGKKLIDFNYYFV